MPSLPSLNVGDIWGALVNNFLLWGHNSDGSHKAYYSLDEFGAVGDGTTDDTTAIQNALDTVAAAGGRLIAPRGGKIYATTASLKFSGGSTPSKVIIDFNGCTIKPKAGTNLTTPVFCDKGWYNNATTCSNPVDIRNLHIDGSVGTSGANAHGFVGMNYWSTFDNIIIDSPTGDGFLFSAHTRNGTHITNTCVEPRILEIQARNCGGTGIHIKDDGSTLNSCTDGFLYRPVVQNAGVRGIDIEMGPGWQVVRPHVYTTGTDGIIVSHAYAFCGLDFYVDGYGTSGTYLAGIGITLLNGRGSSLIGAKVGFEAGAATGPYQGIVLTGSGAGTTIAHISDCQVYGGSQSGSLGYVFQTQPVQRSYPFYVYQDNLDAQGVATRMFQDAYVTGGDTKFLGHIGCENQNAPTAAAGANAGTSPPAPVLTHCTDVAGKVTFGTGTGPAAGAQVVLTFNTAYANNPACVITPLNAATAALNLHVDRTTTTMTVSCVNAPAASQGNTVYGFFYHVFAI